MSVIYKFHKKVDGFDFYAPSYHDGKKYDVYFINPPTGRTVHVSFGDTNYQQYHDKIGYYSSLDHMNQKRRTNYRQRHKNDDLDHLTPGYFSYYYLW